MRGSTILLAVAGSLASASTAAAALPPRAFALVIGVNRSVDPGAPLLRYADDDAARYRDLFRALGVETRLLTTMDDNTRRLHPAGAAEAEPPRFARLEAAVSDLAAEAARARAVGRATALYVIYAGHGNAEGSTGYISLEDRRLTGPELAAMVFDRVHADRSHLIVDACSSYLLVLGRGGGGQRRPLHGFAQVSGALADRPDLGLLLSTSSARESHEWNAFQAGVFSHEVRSGLFGAADADGDGVISYAEIVAFIRRANDAIPNERFRPDVFARPPLGGDALVDIRAGLATRVEIPASEHGHYYLEDAAGIRLADFHNGPDLDVRLMKPADAPRVYLHRTRDHREFVLEKKEPVVSIAGLRAEDPRVSDRSAAHEAFTALFALPFRPSDVTAVGPFRADADLATGEGGELGPGRRWGLVLLGASAAAAAGGGWALLSAQSLRRSITPATEQQTVVERNAAISRRNWMAGGAFGAAGAAAAAGAVLLLWPSPPAPVTVAVSPVGWAVQWARPF
jgi:hypothetical protein